MKALILNKILLFLAAASMLTACYKEAAIHSDKGEVPYKIEDSSDPARHYIYEYNKATGVYILSDYSDVDYSWNVSAVSDNVLVRMDEDALADAVDYLKQVLTEVYPEEFAKRYFPVKVLLADSVTNNSSDDEITAYGRSYIAVGRLGVEDFPKSAGDIKDARGRISGNLWGNIIYGNGLISIPDGFFSPSEEYYGQYVGDDAGAEDSDYQKNFGFWEYDPAAVYDHMLPDRAGDVADYVRYIVTHSSAEIQALMEGYDTMKIKYNILIKAVKDECGIDLQAIGDKYSL